GAAVQVLLRVVPLALQLVHLRRDRFLQLVGRPRLDHLARRGRPVDLPAGRGERAGDAHGDRHAVQLVAVAAALAGAGRDERGARSVVDGAGPDVDPALAADAQQGRPEVEVLAAGDAVPDVEADRHRREVGLLGGVRCRLLGLAAPDQLARLADLLAEVDAADRAVH